MSIKIKKANLRTKPIYTVASKNWEKNGQHHYYGRGNKGLRDREGAKIPFIKAALTDYFPDSATVGIAHPSREDLSFIS